MSELDGWFVRSSISSHRANYMFGNEDLSHVHSESVAIEMDIDGHYINMHLEGERLETYEAFMRHFNDQNL